MSASTSFPSLSSREPISRITSGWMLTALSPRWRTNSEIPPSYLWLTFSFPDISSARVISNPPLRNEVSRSRSSILSYSNTVTFEKNCKSGIKWMVVPVSSLSPTSLTSYCGTPARYSCCQILPSR